MYNGEKSHSNWQILSACCKIDCFGLYLGDTSNRIVSACQDFPLEGFAERA